MSDPFPPCELPLIDLTIRMFTEPRLDGDRALLAKIYNDELLSKNERLYNLDVGEKDLASALKFAELLEAEGIEVAMKPGKLKPIPALAKTDPFMQELLDHDNERIRELAQARLDVKSTINETRSARLLQMANRGGLTIYLHYCGAHTRRWSGGDNANFQNLGRRGDIRKAIRAPEGYLLACPDQSQGECRILNWFAGQRDVIDCFRMGEDPYLPMAKRLNADRQFGKVVELGCGYGMGPELLSSHMKAADLQFDAGFPRLAVNLYRDSHDRVVELWREAGLVLTDLANHHRGKWWRFLKIEDGRLVHPNGTWLDYSGLKWDSEASEYRLYGRYGSWRKMYGAKLVENVVQWLSRIISGEAMIKFHAEGYPVVGMSHDDVWLIVPDDKPKPGWYDHQFHRKTVLEHQAAIVTIMSETPSWALGLPLAAECKIGETYQ